ncbi:AP2 domain-containing protein [Lacrimispora amygdalina]|uniref:AP2 domain-containing protein n=1 Tax=Lacrimispora amygdalina TaxID=253257 RepID=A0A3E2NB59_9FIRM|nr:AP2 domain-containing protein [Clostridium indicum]RFZ78255.1 AP2 domain-containing protein [Clostridium indicum]
MKIGEIGKNSKGTEMKIVSARNSCDIDVQFLDDYGYIYKHNIYTNFKKGNIKNPYDKTISNVGYFGVGEYESLGRKHAKEYDAWRLMIRRCYNEGSDKRYPAYYDKCTVCEEWHNYQVFARWYEENVYIVNERLHIDKDILNPNSHEYSPENCLLVPQRINMLFLNKPNKRGLPNGIRADKHGFSARYNHIELGNFSTLEEAYSKYAKEKEKKIKEISEEYKSIIPTKLYEALMNYKVLLENDKNYIKSNIYKT